MPKQKKQPQPHPRTDLPEDGSRRSLRLAAKQRRSKGDLNYLEAILTTMADYTATHGLPKKTDTLNMFIDRVKAERAGEPKAYCPITDRYFDDILKDWRQGGPCTACRRLAGSVKKCLGEGKLSRDIRAGHYCFILTDLDKPREAVYEALCKAGVTVAAKTIKNGGFHCGMW